MNGIDLKKSLSSIEMHSNNFKNNEFCMQSN
jgi:hypothetical protein